MRTRSHTRRGSKGRRKSSNMEDETLQAEAKKNKALKSKAARQKEKEYKEKLQLQVMQAMREIQKLTKEKTLRQQHIDKLEAVLRTCESKLEGIESFDACSTHTLKITEFSASISSQDTCGYDKWQGTSHTPSTAEEYPEPNVLFPETSGETLLLNEQTSLQGTRYQATEIFDSTSSSEGTDLSSPLTAFVESTDTSSSGSFDSLGINDLCGVEGMEAFTMGDPLPLESTSESFPVLSSPLVSAMSDTWFGDSSTLASSEESFSHSYQIQEGDQSSQLPGIPPKRRASKKSRCKDKQYTYQQPPLPDPREEEKRRRAVKAFENRMKKKNYMSELESQIDNIKKQIEELKNSKEMIEKRIESLQGKC